MVAGCGNSNMLEDMALDGYTNIVGADISRVVIAQLRIRLAKYPQISFFQGQITDTNLKEESFDAIIDKALLDSLLCMYTSKLIIYIN
jgi:2-polyprenyl-3-methyl-5-hydroxy-6-metoxy-1,4-benzoquinol methylase